MAEGRDETVGERERDTGMVYKWTDDDVAKLIRLRRENDHLFSGRRFASAAGWEAVLKEMDLAGRMTAARAAKKWENLKKTYKELRKPPTGSGTESGESTAATWKWFSLMDEAIGGRPSIQPLCLIASAWEENPSASTSASPDSVPDELETGESGSNEPAMERRKRARLDPVLELLERQELKEEERARREEAREERLLRLLEKIVEKM